jgi:AcrR family transcriptional regulator
MAILGDDASSRDTAAHHLVVPRIDARQNRINILRAVRDIVGEKGDDISIREIATTAGVGVATIYRHFDGKAALLDGVSQFRWTQMCKAAEVRDDSLAGIRRVVAVIDRYTKMTTTDDRFISNLGLRPGHDPTGIKPIRDRFDPVFASIWSDGQSRGEIRRGADPGDAIEIAGGVRQSGRRLQMLTLVVAGIATPTIDPEQLIRDMYVRK